MKRALFIIFFLLLSGFATGFPVTFTLYDQNGDTLGNIFVSLDYSYESEDAERITVITSEEGKFTSDFSPGIYFLAFTGDDASTPGKDNYMQTTMALEYEMEKEITMLPVATINGIVKDKLENVIRGAELEYGCNSYYDNKFPSETSKFGTFIIDNAPIGQCTIHASKRDLVGNVNIELTQGELEEVVIVLDQPVKEEQGLSVSWLILIVVLICVAALHFIFRSKKKKEDFDPFETILKTLSANEKKVMTYLKDNDKKSTQAQLKTELMIPHTTLFRVLDRLEKKNLISVKKFGKVKKVEMK